MAVVQYTGVVNQIRGKLNGSVFNKGKTSYTLQRKQQPPKGWRGNQLLSRSVFGYVQRYWKQLTDSQRNSWAATSAANPSVDRFGQQVTLSGYNYFIKAWIRLRSIGAGVPLSGSTLPAPAVSINAAVITNLNIVVNELGDSLISYDFTGSRSSATGQYFAIHRVALPTSTGVTVYHGGWRLISGVGVGTNMNGTITGNLGNRYPAVSPNSLLRFLVELLHRESGAIVDRVELFEVLPSESAISTWSVTPGGSGSNVDLAIAYTPVSTGCPLFHQLLVRSAVLDSPPTDWSDLTRDEPGVEAILADNNTAVTSRSGAPGQYIAYGVRLIWSPTGKVVDESIDYFLIS